MTHLEVEPRHTVLPRSRWQCQQYRYPDTKTGWHGSVIVYIPKSALFGTDWSSYAGKKCGDSNKLGGRKEASAFLGVLGRDVSKLLLGMSSDCVLSNLSKVELG